MAVFAVLLFFFSPSWAAFRLWQRVPEMGGMLEVRRGVSVLAQVAHPGVAIADPLHAVIQWRLLFPAIGHLLSLPAPVFFSLADLGCMLLLGYCVGLLRRRGATWAECTLLTIILGASSWFFTSTGWLGYFDSWLAWALLIVAFANARWVVAFACLWAPWIDERFLPAVVIAFVIRALDRAYGGDQPAVFDWRRELVAPATILAGFVFLRFGLLAERSAVGATVHGYFSGRGLLDAPLLRIALGIWDGLRVGWVLVIAAIALSWRHRSPALVLMSAVIGLIVAGLAISQDYSRSMTMVWPVAVFGAILAARTNSPWRPLVLRIAAGAALLLPAHHVMNNRVNPIYYLYHELAAFRTPPAIAMPELYELRAIHHMERGNFAAAERDLTFAIRLSDNPSSPAKQRGLLAASQGRWADALRDFALMVEWDGQNPDAWFMRAQANLALNHPAAARADLNQALTLAADGWSNRPDVNRFLAKLNQAP